MTTQLPYPIPPAAAPRPRPLALPPLDPADLAVEPLARAATLPSAWYVDPAFHAVDREAVFARSWQGVGDASQVGRPGQYLVATVADDPVIVVRGKDGVLRAFYNVCRHRAGPLALEDGCANALQCKYHGWTYLLDGTLRGVPAMDRTELFDRKDFGLIPVRVAEWAGLVFVCLDAAAPPLETFVTGIAERIAPIRLETLRFARRVEYEVAANWKVYVDNYLEGYHVPYVHPELAKLYDYQRYTTTTFRWYSLQHSPLAGDNLYRRGDGAAGGDEAFYFWLWPNFMFNILPGRLQTNLVLPAGPDRCRVVFRYFYDDVESEAARARIEEDVRYSDAVQAEDAEICARVQQGLASRAYDRGRFSVKYEEGVWHFQSLVREAYARLWSAEAGG
ncbi:MAG TPA: aromatic ring-hydroxylating dioxygenase subunit alpha [Gemmatimonadales bacterium]|nr:aromatic ring-hydroxylating dioxygenase subunit alpha [Gemmatimonadales bacterium]